jgi:hypothetical protein
MYQGNYRVEVMHAWVLLCTVTSVKSNTVKKKVNLDELSREKGFKFSKVWMELCKL